MTVNNPRFPHTCRITRAGSSDNPMSDEGEATVIYDGACRGYEVRTISSSGEVITTNRGLSLPIDRNGWTGKQIPLEGDFVVVDYGPYKESGLILDKATANFGGTHIIWKYDKV